MFRNFLISIFAPIIFLVAIFCFPQIAKASNNLPLGSAPKYITKVGTDLYIANSASSNVSVVDTTTNTVTDTINVGAGPSFSVLAGTDLYVTNTTANTVSVIDTTTNTVTDTIAVGTGPVFANLVGTDLYILNNGGSDVSVIDTSTNTVSATITVGTNPWSGTLVGTDLYVTNTGSNDVKVINTLTETVTATIAVGVHPRFTTLIGTDLYVINRFSNSVKIINTLTNTVTATIAVQTGPLIGYLVGTDFYVNNFNDNEISVISTISHTVTATITVGFNPRFSTLIGTDLYVMNQSSGTISIIDTISKTLSNTILNLGSQPFDIILNGTDLYISNFSSNDLTLVDTTTDTIIDIGPPIFNYGVIDSTTLTLTYDEDLDEVSVPVIGDFVVNVNGTPVVISSVSVVGATVVLTLSDAVLYGDVVEVSYVVPGSNMTQDQVGNDAFALTNQSVVNNTAPLLDCGLITVGNNPYSSIVVGTDLYVLNGDNSVSVIDTDTGTVTDTIPVGSQPLFSTLVGTDLYINNYGEDTISVIDTNTNTVTDTITVGNNPYSSTLVDTNLYVTNSSDGTVSIVNINTNLVTNTIPVGASPYFIVSVGTDLYLNNYGDGTVSVINTNTNLVTSTITVGNSPYFMTLSGTNLYVSNVDDGTVSVINTNTNLVTNTIPVGASPYFSTLVGDILYVSNSGENTVSVINTNTNLATNTITVGNIPLLGILSGTDLFVINYDDSTVSVIDTNTNTVSDTIPVDTNPQLATLVGFKLYVNNSGSNTVSVIDTISKDTLVCGAEYFTLTYSANAHGTLTGDTTQYVSTGEDGTAVTAVPDDGYDFEDWSDNSTENPRTDTNVSGNISVTANFSLRHGGGSSGSNPIIRIINEILDPILPDPEVILPPDNTPPVEPDVPVVPIVPVIPTPPVEEVLPTEIPSTPVVTNPVNENTNNFVSTPNAEYISMLDRVSIFIKDPVGNVISRGVALAALGLAFLVGIFANVGSLADIGLNLLRFWSMFLYGVGLKKRNRPWGVVYDSVTKQPLDPVYVVLLDLQGKEVATSITDMDGRYGFLVEPGIYKIKVNKNNYNFPSEKLSGKNSDELYSDLYFGETIEVRQKDEVIAKNIPMDQIGFNWNEFAKKEQGKMKFYHTRDLVLSRFTEVFTIIGFLVSLVILFVLPEPYNVIVFCLYLVLFSLKHAKLIKKKKGSVVYDKSGIPISYGIIRMYGAANGIEMAHRVLDKKGSYYMLIQNGDYLASVEKKNDDGSYTKVFDDNRISVKNGILKKNFRV